MSACRRGIRGPSSSGTETPIGDGSFGGMSYLNGGKHLFADGNPFGPDKQFLADFLGSRGAAFLLCPLMLQKWTVR
jgi:hypothetical protein